MEPISIFIWIAYLLALYFLIFWLLNYLSKRDAIKEDKLGDNKLDEFPLVSVIIPAYNERDTILKTLKSVLNLDYPSEKLEVLVINDGSTDNTGDIVSKFIKKTKNRQVTLINQLNTGKAGALNHGLSKIKGKYFACLDADSFIESKSLKHMVKMHLKDNDLAVVTPVMKVYSPKTLIQKFQRLEYMASMLIVKLMSYLDANYVAPGPFSLYKTRIVRKLGGFDENSLVEDQEIAFKIQQAHYRIRQCSNAVVSTIAPRNLRSLGKQRNRWIKGTLLNLFDYRHMIFNKNYGDFGLFQIPLTLTSYFLSIIALASLVYYTIAPLLRNIKKWWLVGFDLSAYFKDWNFDFNILNTNIPLVLIIYLMLLGSVVILYFASRMTDEKVKSYGFIYIVPYFFLYFIILSFITVKVLLEILIGKKQKW